MNQNPFTTPFWEHAHTVLAAQAANWVHGQKFAGAAQEGPELDALCRQMVQQLALAGWLRYAVPQQQNRLDVRALCVLRQTFAQHLALLDFVFVMQALGSGPIALFGTEDQRKRYLPRVVAGQAIPAFALSELDAGSDAAALMCQAQPISTPSGSGYVLNGRKAWVSQGCLADFYVVFARLAPAPYEPQPFKRTAGITAFIVDAGTPGLTIDEKVTLMSPHPMAHIRLEECFIPSSQRIGAEGEGFAIAMRTLDVFRSTVAAAAVGLSRRALQEALNYARQRPMRGQVLADLPIAQAHLARMVAQIEAAHLLMSQAAWLCDQGQPPTQAAALAKWVATENAQQVVDTAMQLCGARAVVAQHPLEVLYREVRALRIYEGASDVQQLIVARELLRECAGFDAPQISTIPTKEA